MNDKLNKTSRVSQETKPLRNKPWAPPSSLDAPPAPKGYVHRWIRTEFMGQEDTGNVSKKLREGWEFVRAEEIKNTLGDHDFPVIHEGKHAGLIGIGGLVLARISSGILANTSTYYKNKTKGQIEAVDNDVLREQRPEMPINIDRQSRVTFGSGTKK
jgi:hypothetical protein